MLRDVVERRKIKRAVGRPGGQAGVGLLTIMREAEREDRKRSRLWRIERIKGLLRRGMSGYAVAQRVKCSKPYVYRIQKEMEGSNE